MAWNPKGGGPWGGGGGGGGGPWGGGGGPSGSPPPNVEEMLRRSQDKLKKMLPGGMGAGRAVLLGVTVVIAIWLASGFYRVQPGEQGVELLFGRFVKVTTPGLNYWFPAPIGEVLRPDVERINQITVGFRGGAEIGRGAAVRDIPQESLMLTGDQNIIDVDFAVQWRIKDSANFLFNIRDPENTVKLAAESAIREIMGQTPLEEALTKSRTLVEDQTKELLQTILDGYESGVLIAEVKQQTVDPPSEVIDAFNDVQRARQDQERSINEAVAYRNDIVPRAKGEAARVVQEATAYKEKLAREAEGEAKRFLAVYEAYRTGKDVTKRRLYLERLEQVLRDTEKIIIDNGAGGGVVPYLPLNELMKPRQGAAQ